MGLAVHSKHSSRVTMLLLSNSDYALIALLLRWYRINRPVDFLNKRIALGVLQIDLQTKLIHGTDLGDDKMDSRFVLVLNVRLKLDVFDLC